MTTPVKKRAPAKKKKNAAVRNDFASAIGYDPYGTQGSPYSKQITKATTIFENMRWYLVSNFRQMLNQAYVEIGLVGTICRVPVEDALRGGIKISSAQLSPEEIKKLEVSVDRDQDLINAGQAGIWNRLFGGAGIIILTDQDPETPLDVAAIGKDTPLEFRPVDLWELLWTIQNNTNIDPMTQMVDTEFYNYYGVQVHKSRVMKITGIELPSFIRPRMRGWGGSVVEALVRSINQYLKATDLTFEVLDEFKVDVYKIKNLVDTLLSPIGDQQVQRRIQMANWQKNYQNAVVMDSEDDWDHKQLSFTGLAETMQQIRMQVASDMRMPLTKLFGISATGFNSGEDDIEVYNAMVESEVRNKLKYVILRMLEIKCQKMFGYIPEDLAIDFQSLRIMSSEQEETVKTQKFSRLTQALQLGQITAEEFRDACNADDLLPITLQGTPPKADRTDIAGGAGAEAEEKDDSNPGEARSDTDKPRADSEGGAPENVVKQNSLEFERRKYVADGGPTRFNTNRIPFVKDENLWNEAKRHSKLVMGEEDLAFAFWYYQKQGGKV